MELSIAAVICAAGSSSRMGGIKKEFLILPSASRGGKPLTVLGAAASAFASCAQIGPIVITVPGKGEDAAKASLPEELHSSELRSGGPLPANSHNRVYFVSGGPTRRASVYNALKFLDSFNPAYVLIHDGSRPWVKVDLIERIIEAVISYGAAIPALPLIETPKELCGPLGPGIQAAFIKRHLRRAELCTVQTPQGFKFPELLRAHEKARVREERENVEYTDDAEVWGEFIGQVAAIPGDPENRKITYPEDIK